MKLIKNIFWVVFLIMILIVPNKVNAEENYNYTTYKIEFTVKEPVEGDIPPTTAIVESGTYKGTVDISWYESTDLEDWVSISTPKFEHGKFYSPYISLTMEQIYDEILSTQDLSTGGSIIYYINNQYYELESHIVNFPIGIYKVVGNIMDLELYGDFFASTKKDFVTTLKGVEGFRIPDEIKIIIKNKTLIKNTDYFYNSETGEIRVLADELIGDLEIQAEGIMQFDINIEYVEGDSVLKSEVMKVDKGESVNNTIYPIGGYFIRSVKVNNVEQSLDKNILEINDIKENKKVVVELEKYQYYNVLEGENQTWNGTGNLTIKIDANKDKFLGIYVGVKGENVVKILTENVDFKIDELGTIILNESYLSSLENKEYIFIAVYGKGEASTYFTVDRVKYEENTNKEEINDITSNNTENNIVENSSNPKTGDNIISYIILGIISLIGIYITNKFIKKYND